MDHCPEGRDPPYWRGVALYHLTDDEYQVEIEIS